MAQKSLPSLNKVNTSMIWYSTFFHKHYRWLSSQNLYLLCYLNKLLISINYFNRSLLWTPYEYPTTSWNSIEGFKLIKSKHKANMRFFKPVTSYFVSINSSMILINLYYSTSLERFQELNNPRKGYETNTYILSNLKCFVQNKFNKQSIHWKTKRKVNLFL